VGAVSFFPLMSDEQAKLAQIVVKYQTEPKNGHQVYQERSWLENIELHTGKAIKRENDRQ
jgi:hypothetical protein